MHEILAMNRRINSLRRAKGESNMELAEQLGYSESTVRDWERGNTMPDVMVLCDIADHFEVSLDFLLFGEFSPGENDGKAASADTLGERIRGIRFTLGLQQKELAHLMGAKNCTVCLYEHDDEIPRRQNLLKLAEALDVSVDYLMRGKTGGGKNDAILDSVKEGKKS